MRLPALLSTSILILAGCAGGGNETAAPADSTAQTGAVTAQVALNANIAERDALAALAPVGPALADSLVAHRPFLTTETFTRVVTSMVPEDAQEAVFTAVWVPMDLNSGSEATIGMIPGVGERMTHEFLEYRPYVSMAQFRREMSKYVDEAEVERLASFVYVKLDLNTATDEEILAIPGIGQRMLREFKEYRPYTDMAQFRREMGKYVSESEVARLERYVEVRPAN